MALAPELKEILACPKCKGDLEFREEEQRILCRACKLAYRIERFEDGKGDIPVMLIDEATPLGDLDEGKPQPVAVPRPAGA
jgi:uncharacterized protein YbaR (Trm112 family)